MEYENLDASGLYDSYSRSSYVTWRGGWGGGGGSDDTARFIYGEIHRFNREYLAGGSKTSLLFACLYPEHKC